MRGALLRVHGISHRFVEGVTCEAYSILEESDGLYFGDFLGNHIFFYVKSLLLKMLYLTDLKKFHSPKLDGSYISAYVNWCVFVDNAFISFYPTHQQLQSLARTFGAQVSDDSLALKK
jgi:hypothetical protein